MFCAGEGVDPEIMSRTSKRVFGEPKPRSSNREEEQDLLSQSDRSLDSLSHRVNQLLSETSPGECAFVQDIPEI